MVLLLCCQCSYSQQFPNIQFNYLTEKEGLSSNIVTSIAQDEEGFIWVGTGDGMNRLDGYRVRRFYHNPANENSLVNNGIHQIVPDESGRLWITTREGLSVYDKKTGAFRNFRHNPADVSTLDDDQYANVYVGKNSSTWLTTSGSVYHFDSSFHYNKISTGIKNLEDFERRKIETYHSLILDRRGNLWGIKQGYVFLIDKKTMKVAKIFGPFNGNIETIYQDSNLKFWLCSFGGGLMSFDPESNGSFLSTWDPQIRLCILSLSGGIGIISVGWWLAATMVLSSLIPFHSEVKSTPFNRRMCCPAMWFSMFLLIDKIFCG